MKDLDKRIEKDKVSYKSLIIQKLNILENEFNNIFTKMNPHIYNIYGKKLNEKIQELLEIFVSTYSIVNDNNKKYELLIKSNSLLKYISLKTNYLFDKFTIINNNRYIILCHLLEEISRLLYGIIKTVKKKINEEQNII